MTVGNHFPDWVEPMAATLTQERFAGPDWKFECNLDGIRLLAFRAWPRRADPLAQRAAVEPRLSRSGGAIAHLPVCDVILDGEAIGVWFKQGRIAYHIFDILWVDGRDVTGLPIEERQALLAKLPLSRRWCVPSLHDAKPWDRACAEGWEGVIAKRRGSVYEHKRWKHWLKMKGEATQELVVWEQQGTCVETA